jgi:hypothetical protein
VYPHVQRLVSVFKMAIVLEGVLMKSNVFLYVLWAKGYNVKNIHKEIFSVYGGKYFPR